MYSLFHPLVPWAGRVFVSPITIPFWRGLFLFYFSFKKKKKSPLLFVKSQCQIGFFWVFFVMEESQRLWIKVQG